jgi:hypothetical protein
LQSNAPAPVIIVSGVAKYTKVHRSGQGHLRGIQAFVKVCVAVCS